MSSAKPLNLLALFYHLSKANQLISSFYSRCFLSTGGERTIGQQSLLVSVRLHCTQAHWCHRLHRALCHHGWTGDRCYVQTVSAAVTVDIPPHCPPHNAFRCLTWLQGMELRENLLGYCQILGYRVDSPGV